MQSEASFIYMQMFTRYTIINSFIQFFWLKPKKRGVMAATQLQNYNSGVLKMGNFLNRKQEKWRKPNYYMR